MKLNELSPAEGSTKNRKRLGRGNASGQGTYAGKGCKGLNARSGSGVRPGYEGGQMPIHRRLPKRGFTNIFKKNFAILNVKDLEKFQNGDTIDEQTLVEVGLVKGRRDGIKILGKGEISIAVTVKNCTLSETAKQKIESAGGKIEA